MRNNNCKCRSFSPVDDSSLTSLNGSVGCVLEREEYHRTLLQRRVVDDEHTELNDNIIELTGVDVIEESSKQFNGTTLIHREMRLIVLGSRS